MICCRVFFYIALDNLCSREVSIVILYPTWSHVEHVDMLTVCQLPQGAYNRDLQRTCCRERSTLILSETFLRADVGPHWTEAPDRKADMAVCVGESDVG